MLLQLWLLVCFKVCELVGGQGVVISNVLMDIPCE